MDLPKCKELKKYVQNLLNSKVVTRTEITGRGHLRLFLSNGRFVVIPSNKGDERTVQNVKSHVRKELSFVQ